LRRLGGRLLWVVGGLLALFIALGLFLQTPFMRQDMCLDSGGAWRDDQCVGARPGG
jgi:hypothetical protein